MGDGAAFVSWFERMYPERSSELGVLLEYGELVRRGNPRLGLVSRGDLDRLHTRHLQECLAPELLDVVPEGAALIDVGSGGGMPGIPLAVMRRDVRVTLLEPRQKKAAFLDRCGLLLNLRVPVIVKTLEELARSEGAAHWEVATSRGIRWTPGLAACLSKVIVEEGTLIRFGAPHPGVPGVRSVTLQDSLAPRAIQSWPRNTWVELHKAEQ
jgi:16S rRNA (guanine(527)-N(7))-methyltransferase RsmG